MNSWLEKNDIEMYSTHNEGKYVAAERVIKTLKNQIYKHMIILIYWMIQLINIIIHITQLK